MSKIQPPSNGGPNGCVTALGVLLFLVFLGICLSNAKHGLPIHR